MVHRSELSSSLRPGADEFSGKSEGSVTLAASIEFMLLSAECSSSKDPHWPRVAGADSDVDCLLASRHGRA
jgi:hypothetical protein